ncbi:MAG TPA: recombinase family protein [Gemmataceae bacterium]
MPRRAYSYLRFSHPKQASGDSVRRQEEWTEQLCRRHSWYLDDTLRFADKGRSAFRGGLKALGQFRDLVRRGRIAPGSVLVVELLDRLSREEVDDAYDIFREIIRAGVWIATREPERIYSRKTSGNMLELLEPLFIFARAHDESRAKSMRIREVWVHQHRKAREEKKPIQSRPPWWLTKGPHGYELIPEHAEAIRLMRSLCLSGHGYMQIAGELARRGFRPPGREWCIETIRNTLKSRRTLGEHQPGHKVKGRLVPDGPPIQGYYPAIFTEEEREAALTAIQRRDRKRPGRPAKDCANLFTGLVHDAISRLPMSKCSARPERGGKKYNSLMCRNAYYGRAVCRVPYEPRRGQPGFEDCVLDTLAMLRPQDVLDEVSRSDEREHRIEALTKRVTALSRSSKVN